MKQPRDVVLAWVEAFNRADVDGLLSLYADGAVNHQVAESPVVGRRAIREMFEAEFSRAEMVCLVEQVLQDDEWAILEWRDPLGLRGCGLFYVQDGLIVFQRGYWDELSFLRQHGLPVPESGVAGGSSSVGMTQGSATPESRYVFLDPDGTAGSFLYVIVRAETGVVYAAQVAGHQNEERSLEGFLVPLVPSQQSDRLVRFFADEFHGHPDRTKWTEERVTALESLVARIPCWHTSRDDNDMVVPLALDGARMDECTEGWVPVQTPYGAGVLTFNNCD